MKLSKYYMILFLLLAGFFQGQWLYGQSQKHQVSVQTDGSSYITGEQVWCSIRIYDSVSGKPR